MTVGLDALGRTPPPAGNWNRGPSRSNSPQNEMSRELSRDGDMIAQFVPRLTVAGVYPQRLAPAA